MVHPVNHTLFSDLLVRLELLVFLQFAMVLWLLWLGNTILQGYSLELSIILSSCVVVLLCCFLLVLLSVCFVLLSVCVVVFLCCHQLSTLLSYHVWSMIMIIIIIRNILLLYYYHFWSKISKSYQLWSFVSTVTQIQENNLFFALRGAGSSFGIVTEFIYMISET